MKNKNKQILIFLSLTILLILFALGYLYYKNSKTKIEIFELKDAVKYSENLPSEQEIKANTESIIESKSKISNFLIERSNPLDFMESIEISISKNDLKGEIKSPSYIDTNFVLEVIVEGQFENLLNFLNDIETAQKEVSLQNIRFTKKQSQKGNYWSMFIGIVAKTK
jgi:hypothetical protein